MVNIDRKIIPGLPVLNNLPIENSSPVLTGYNLRLLVCPTIPVSSFDEDQIHKLAVSQTLGLLVFIPLPNTVHCTATRTDIKFPVFLPILGKL